MSRSLETRRTPMMLLALFGAVALVLSAIGIYGVLAFGVAQRGARVRHPPGARRRWPSILSLVLKQGLMTAGIGIVLGLIGAVSVSRFMQTMLFGVGEHDPACLRASRSPAGRRDRRVLHPGAAARPAVDPIVGCARPEADRGAVASEVPSQLIDELDVEHQHPFGLPGLAL